MFIFFNLSDKISVFVHYMILIWYAAGRGGGVDRLPPCDVVNTVYFILAIRVYSMEEILQKCYHSPLKII